MEKEMYHERLYRLMDEFVHEIYKVTQTFPKNEMYGVTSQIRRSSLSVILNYIEGYARFRKKINKNFLEISYGSLKETKYLIEFTKIENYIKLEKDFDWLMKRNDEIGKMLWGIIHKL